MTTTLVTILVSATCAALAAALLKRMPTAQFCPTCRHRTQSVRAPLWLRPMSARLALRWCPDCAWQGVGRKGPEYVPGRPAAHDSGFHWSRADAGEDKGFVWRRDTPPPSAAPRTQHPSGFRFAEGHDQAPTEASPPPLMPPAHPSGFAWAGPDGTTGTPERRKAGHASGFLWGDRKTDRAGGSAPPEAPRGFAWKESAADQPSEPDAKPGDFHWGGAA